MLKSMEEMIQQLEGRAQVKISVASAQDPAVLSAVNRAQEAGIAQSILVGDEPEIIRILKEMNADTSKYEIIHVDGDLAEQAKVAVELVSKGRAQVLMKGLLDTSILLKEVLKKEHGLRTGKIMSTVGLIESSYYHKLFIITDPGMNIRPNLDQKKEILENAVDFARQIGIETPKVAVLAAKEKINEKMPETVDAGKLVEMYQQGEIKDCVVAGPLAFDIIISREAAAVKGIDSPVAGDADIILFPEIVSGNTLYKGLAFLSEIKSAGVLLGAKVPIVMTSRADSEDTKLYSIIAASLAGSLNI